MRDADHSRHDGGVVTGARGLYVLGLPVLRTRASTYIHGAADDTEAIAAHLRCFLGNRRESDRSVTNRGS